MTIDKPQALYVYAHPDTRSFNRQLFDAGRSALERTHEVVTSDLYSMGFDPTLSRTDLGDLANEPKPFLDRWTQAAAEGELPDEVGREQQKLLTADLIIFQFPLWWYSVPAILKGWFDRVFSSGFGFNVTDPETGLPWKYGGGLLAGRRALLAITLGEDLRTVGSRGIAGDLESLLFGVTHGTLFYAGIEPFPLHTIPDADGLSPDAAQHEIERFTDRVSCLGDETPIPFRTMMSGDYRPGRALREDLASGRTDLGIHRTDA